MRRLFLELPLELRDLLLRRYELYDLRRDPGEQQRLPTRDLRRTGLTERLAAVRAWNQALHAALVAHGAQRRAAPDPETAERLRALGYFDQ